MAFPFRIMGLSLGIALFGLLAGVAPTMAATTGLVKGSTPAVYYATAEGYRYAFPNEKTYLTWFTDFSRVQTISDTELARLTLRANVTYRPGVRLVKITTDPKVYAVSRGGVLRWVQTETLARSLYGANWAQQVDDVPDAFFTNYTVGNPIVSISDYNPTEETQRTATIEQDKGLILTPTPLPTPTPVPSGSYPGALRTISVSNVSALRESVNTARPGDVIRVAPGTYRFSQQWWVEAKGTMDHPIYIVAAGARGSASVTGTDDEGLNVGGAAYLVFEGLELHHTNGNVVHVQDGAHHITLRNLNVHDAGPDGDVVKINQAHHITVEGCDLARPGRRPDGNEAVWQEALDLVDVDDAVIRRNFIHDVGNMAGYVKGGSRRALIEDNVIMDQRSGVDGNPLWGIGGWTDAELLGGEQYEAIDTIFRHNVVAHTLYGGLALFDAQNSLIEHNLFLNNSPVEIQSRAGNAPRASTDSVTIRDNIFTNTTGRLGTICELLNHDLHAVTASGNTYWNNGSVIPTESSCGFTPTREPGARVQNPQITNAQPLTYDQAMALLSF